MIAYDFTMLCVTLAKEKSFCVIHSKIHAYLEITFYNLHSIDPQRIGL